MSDQDETDVEPVVDDKPDPIVKDDETVSMSKSEVDALRRQAAEGQKAARKAKQEVEKQDAEKAKAEGRWKELAEENERKAADAEAKLTERDRRDRVTAAAKRLKFDNPDLAYRLLDPEDRDDDQLTEKALKSLLTENPGLKVPEQRRTGTSIRGGNAEGEPEKDPMLGIAKDLHAHLSGRSQ